MLAPTGARDSGIKTIPCLRSCTNVQTAAHSSHSQYRSTLRAWSRTRAEDGGLSSLDLATSSLSTKNSLPWRSRRNGLEHREFAQWLSIMPSAELPVSSSELISETPTPVGLEAVACEMPDRFARCGGDSLHSIPCLDPYPRQPVPIRRHRDELSSAVACLSYVISLPFS
jgi:hypothetical protein